MPETTAVRKTKKAAAPVTITLPELAKGERYAGLILDAKGAPVHHLVLLTGDTEDVTWEEAKAWAAKQGGELPSRAEQSLLFANAKDAFKPRWYWSAEQFADDADYAWFQSFDYGYQYANYVSNRDRARAVRRVPIQ